MRQVFGSLNIWSSIFHLLVSSVKVTITLELYRRKWQGGNMYEVPYGPTLHALDVCYNFGKLAEITKNTFSHLCFLVNS